VSRSKTVSDVSVARFHSLYNDGRIEQIYAESSAGFRELSSFREFNRLMTAVEQKLGKVTSSVNTNWKVTAFNLRTSVVMVQITQFDRGTAKETFTFHIEGDNAVLFGYFIDSE